MLVSRSGIAGLGGSDPLIWTPGSIEALKGEVDSLAVSLGADARSAWEAGQISANTWTSLRAFMAEWVNYRDSVGFFATLTGATADTLKRYRERFVDWRNALARQGVSLSSPAPPKAEGAFDGLATGAKWIGIGALALAGVMIASTASKRFS